VKSVYRYQSTVTTKGKSEVSWKAEVTTIKGDNWIANRVRFATALEAVAYVCDLQKRWPLVVNTNVVNCDDPVNYRYIDGELLAVVPLWQPQVVEAEEDELEIAV
jgi:hypothetical protein